MTLAAAGAPMARLRGLGDRLRALPRARRWAAGASLVWAVVVLGYAAQRRVRGSARRRSPSARSIGSGRAVAAGVTGS